MTCHTVAASVIHAIQSFVVQNSTTDCQSNTLQLLAWHARKLSGRYLILAPHTAIIFRATTPCTWLCQHTHSMRVYKVQRLGTLCRHDIPCQGKGFHFTPHSIAFWSAFGLHCLEWQLLLPQCTLHTWPAFGHVHCLSHTAIRHSFYLCSTAQVVLATMDCPCTCCCCCCDNSSPHPTARHGGCA